MLFHALEGPRAEVDGRVRSIGRRDMEHRTKNRNGLDKVLGFEWVETVEWDLKSLDQKCTSFGVESVRCLRLPNEWVCGRRKWVSR